MIWNRSRVQWLGRVLLRWGDVTLGVMYGTLALLGVMQMTPRAILVTVPIFAGGAMVMARRTMQAV